MDIKLESACKILDINFTYFSELTYEHIKKKYHYMALRYHPDKNGNTLESTRFFQKIQEAYEYLTSIIKDSNDTNETDRNINKDYIILLSLFISNIIKGGYDENILNIIKLIINGCKEITKRMFEDFDRDICIEIYQFLCKYKDILYIGDNIVSQVKIILMEKFKNDKIYILNPSLDDLFDNNIYKLMVDDKMYLVPLWHNEIYFDGSGGDIIVYCVPMIDNVNIDENNNLHMELSIEFKTLLSEKYITFMLGRREFNIPVDKLFIKSTQFFTLKHNGISQIIENGDIYNTLYKSDIIIKIILL
jgi:hypothetical protein